LSYKYVWSEIIEYTVNMQYCTDLLSAITRNRIFVL